MILLPVSIVLSSFIQQAETVFCAKGYDYGNGDCLEPQCTPMDRLSAERYCRTTEGILYSPNNRFATNQIMQLMGTQCPGVDDVWLGITCINETTCYNDRGQLIELNKNYTVFLDDITEPCVYMSLDRGFWFGSGCRDQAHKRPFICWYTNNKTDSSCQPGTFFYKNRCYGLHGLQDAIATSDHCHNLGGELVSIHSEIENDYIWDLAAGVPSVTANANYGIGLYVDKDKELKWYDGSPVDYINFEDPANPPADEIFPPNSTVMVDVMTTKKKWIADPTRGRLAQVCSWPPLTQDLQTVKATFVNLCATGVLPINSMIYSPGYPDYTSTPSCTLTYNGELGKPIQIMFEEQFLDVGASIVVYIDKNDTQKATTIEYNTPPTTIISSFTGYMKVVFIQSSGKQSYWRASTKSQGVKGQYPIALGTPAVCSPDKVLVLSTKTQSQFQTLNYATNSGMSRPCTIVISPQSASNTVAVSFYDFYLGPEDRMDVIDGDATVNPTPRTTLSGTEPGIRIEGKVGQKLSFKIYGVARGFRGIWADFTSN